jgi:hypothetical protein
MNRLATWKIPAFAMSILFSMFCNAAEPSKDFDEIEGPNVRVTRHEDGSRTTFTRTTNNQTLAKRKFTANGVLQMLTIYRMDPHGNPISCKIYDGDKNLMFKVRYAYRKIDGQLAEEQMFDARVVRRDPNSGKEMPVQRIVYLFDDQGNRSAPIVYNLLPGKKFEEVFGEKSSALEANPFK